MSSRHDLTTQIRKKTTRTRHAQPSQKWRNLAGLCAQRRTRTIDYSQIRGGSFVVPALAQKFCLPRPPRFSIIPTFEETGPARPRRSGYREHVGRRFDTRRCHLGDAAHCPIATKRADANAFALYRPSPRCPAPRRDAHRRAPGRLRHNSHESRPGSAASHDWTHNAEGPRVRPCAESRAGFPGEECPLALRASNRHSSRNVPAPRRAARTP